MALGMSVLKWLGGADNMTKTIVLAHITWRVGSKMDWRGILVRLDQSVGPDGDRAVRVNQRFMLGGRDGSATIGY